MSLSLGVSLLLGRSTSGVSASSYTLLQHSYRFVMQQLLSLLFIFQDLCGYKLSSKLFDLLPRTHTLAAAAAAAAAAACAAAAAAAACVSSILTLLVVCCFLEAVSLRC